MKIYIETDTSDAPGSLCYLVNGTGDRSLLIQSEDAACSVAETFGWSIEAVQVEDEDGVEGECRHCHTDGSVDCPECGVKSSAFVSAACEFINDNDGESAEDPGYFGDDD